VQAKPTIRINILTARFMGCSPCVQVPWERKPSRAGIIQVAGKESRFILLVEFRLLADGHEVEMDGASLRLAFPPNFSARCRSGRKTI
jgi:hypothetical protein